ncbi:conserved hypothetical protein [Leishmania mexicana MHOM/GT/2001/U1103]|uniref:Uncharacterized protein n=1 Tax=Leishmania mexicana (strain MHOM/GT/2001/U1103) TaxID=929439 RepID=E9AL94_LEIMU|nr:conserved hypothetical protein [Leishmania mexicana MHOM/GT/2001/U1103]CBZ23697.1 conserved hypothetical protein [Leishmania mexicana MHOM/GT/2001/U1103]
MCSHLPPPPQAQEANNGSLSNDTHAGQMAREQQQMIEQLMSTGLVQAADLLEFGFSAAELRAAGLHLPSPHHRAGEQTKGGGEAAQAEWMTDAHSEDRRRCGVPRKRAWRDDAAQARLQKNERAAQSPAVSSAAATALLAAATTREPQTVAKSVVTPALLSEETRARSLQAARLVEQTQSLRRHRGAQDCARWLCYDDTEDEEVSSTASTGTSAGEATSALASMARAAETMPKARCNTALAFSGLDVAVVKEIAQLLQEESDHDASVESRRTREYLESRENGHTPYM